MGEPGTVAAVGLFESPEALLSAVAALEGRGLGDLEAYTPHPVHGLGRALGRRPSPLGGMVLAMGVLGALVGLGFQAWVCAVDYPLVTGGKAPGSWEAFVPIMFEVTVLFAAFTAGLGGLLLLDRLPFWGHPLLGSRAMGAVTRDRYALALEGDPLPDPAGARRALEAAGAREVELLERPVPAPLTSRYLLRLLGACAVTALASGAAAWGTARAVPRMPPFRRMLVQPRVGPQQASAFFRDGRAMRMPVAGTVARGHLPFAATEDEARRLVNPLPVTEAVMAQGRRAYRNRCLVCHGPLGTGTGTLTAAYGATAANLQAPHALALEDGMIFRTVTLGQNAMPGHAWALDEDERWAVVRYVRALQRARNAHDEDLGGAP
jgi:mono/diheme cytochrome c family protein